MPACPRMANIYFDPGEQRANKVNDLFARIAPRYDLINDLQSFGLHRYWKRRVIRLAHPQPGDRALDVCCGTGDLALALARGGAQVAGVDFSERMLEVATRKRSEGNLKPEIGSQAAGMESQVTADRGQTAEGRSQESEVALHVSRFTFHASRLTHFIRADAQQIPFRDNSFDIVTVGYGLRNLASWETGLGEMQRVAKAGGRLLVLDFGQPNNPLWRSLYFSYLRSVVPWLGRIFCGNAAAYAYILESLKHYPAQRGVAAKMRDLGLVNVRIINLLGAVMTINYGEKGSDE